MIEYNKQNPLRCFYAFAGYNSQKIALKRLAEHFPEFHHVCVGWSEIDANAIKANNAVFPEDSDKNFGDITKIDWSKVPDFDLFTYSFPCQSISSSGKQEGLEEGSGTRSSLLWECKKSIEIKKPRFLMMENVKALTHKKFQPYLKKWQTWLYQQGYENFTQVLNASDYGVPQNRERVFMISILRTDGEPNPSFYFPKKMKLERCIKDILEPNVDESFYLSDKALEYFCRVNNSRLNDIMSYKIERIFNIYTGKILGGCYSGNVYGIYGIAPTLNCMGGGNRMPLILIKNEKRKKYRIRKLTQTECFRLQDVSDDDIEKIRSYVDSETAIICDANGEPIMNMGFEKPSKNARKITITVNVEQREYYSSQLIWKNKGKGISKTAQYKLAGNSICIAPMYHIFRKLFVEKE